MSVGKNLMKHASTILRNRVAYIHGLPEVYKPSISRNREKLMELIREKAEQASKSEVARKIRVAKEFYRLEMAPPGVGEMRQVLTDLAVAKEFIFSGAYKSLTVKQMWLLFLVCVEIGMWFYLGETIGKMHIVGYKV